MSFIQVIFVDVDNVHETALVLVEVHILHHLRDHAVLLVAFGVELAGHFLVQPVIEQQHLCHNSPWIQIQHQLNSQMRLLLQNHEQQVCGQPRNYKGSHAHCVQNRHHEQHDLVLNVVLFEILAIDALVDDLDVVVVVDLAQLGVGLLELIPVLLVDVLTLDFLVYDLVEVNFGLDVGDDEVDMHDVVPNQKREHVRFFGEAFVGVVALFVLD